MKNCKVRKNIKIAAWAAAFALAVAVGFGGCTNASDSSGGSGDAGGNGSAGETNFTIKTVGGDTVLTGYEGEKPRGNIILPSGITKIGYNAFLNCNDLTGQLTVPDGVTKIDAGAFSGCKRLETLVLPSALTSIGGFAFYQCENLKEKLVFPENLTFIGEKAFMGCTKITSITIRSGNVATIKDYAFSLKSSISDILFTVKTGAVKTLLKGSQSGIVDGQITVAPSI